MTRQRSDIHNAAHAPRPSRRIHQEKPGKLPELAGCPDCGASYRNGRWTWQVAPAGSYQKTCPACERIATDYPAGLLRVEGAFATSHHDELLGMIRNIESSERSDHPLARIMKVVDDDDGFVVTVTDARLTETFGRALERAYEGRLEHPATTSDRENLVRVRWTRD